MLENGKIEKGHRQNLIDLGVKLLPKFLRDSTDRNRTSPFAFTGAKFEFRAVGSSMNISTPIAVINTAVADSLSIVVERIKAEQASTSNFREAVLKVLSGLVKESKAILFEGNNYSEEWVKEAQKRGLPNEASTAEALKAFIKPKSIDLFERHGVFTKVELHARYNIWLEIYEKVLDIEAKALAEMVRTQVIPAAIEYQAEIAGGLEILKDLVDSKAVELVDEAIEDRKQLLAGLTADIFYIRKNLKQMEELLKKADTLDPEAKAAMYYSELKPHMLHIRKHVDALESVMPDSMWVLPKYREMLFIS